MLFGRKQERKQAIQFIVDYVEGKMSANAFREEFFSNMNLQRLLKKTMSRKFTYLKKYDYQLYNLFMYGYDYRKEDWNNISMRYGLQFELKQFLLQNRISFDEFEKYTSDYMFTLKIQPSWLDCVDDQGIFDKILEEMPKDLSKTKQIAWGKARIKELFRYDKTYPRWIQSPEWPIVNGKPLVFSHQKSAGKDDVRTYYYFYDPDTKEETVITQMY